MPNPSSFAGHVSARSAKPSIASRTWQRKASAAIGLRSKYQRNASRNSRLASGTTSTTNRFTLRSCAHEPRTKERPALRRREAQPVGATTRHVRGVQGRPSPARTARTPAHRPHPRAGGPLPRNAHGVLQGSHHIEGAHRLGAARSVLAAPLEQQVDVDAVLQRNGGHRGAGLLAQLEKLALERRAACAPGRRLARLVWN